VPADAKIVVASLAALAGLGLGFAFLGGSKSQAPAPKQLPTGSGTAPPAAPPGTTPPATPPGTTPTPGAPSAPGQNWVAATSAGFLSRVRWTMTQAQAAALVGAAAPPTRESVAAALTATWMQQILQSRLLFVWGPNDQLPTDWPMDDAFNVEILYGIGYAPRLTSGASAPALSIADLKAYGVGVSGMWVPSGLLATPSSTSSLTWTKADVLNPGDHVRAEMPSVNWLVINQSLGNVADAACLSYLLILNAAAPYAALLGTSSILPWCPGDVLPPDWPGLGNDPTGLAPPATEFCLEFRYAGAPGLAVSTLPGAPTAWVAKGVGA
jgi:hypothetical protein